MTVDRIPIGDSNVEELPILRFTTLFVLSMFNDDDDDDDDDDENDEDFDDGNDDEDFDDGNDDEDGDEDGVDNTNDGILRLLIVVMVLFCLFLLRR